MVSSPKVQICFSDKRLFNNMNSIKHLFILLCILIVNLISLGQTNNQSPILNLGFGYGATHGGLGLKGVLGHNNSGLLLGVGKAFTSNIMGFTIGAQVSIGDLYADICYGMVGLNGLEKGHYKPQYGISILFGGIINLGKTKQAFIDMSIGPSIYSKLKYGYQIVKVDYLVYNIGMGYRF